MKTNSNIADIAIIADIANTAGFVIAGIECIAKILYKIFEILLNSGATSARITCHANSPALAPSSDARGYPVRIGPVEFIGVYAGVHWGSLGLTLGSIGAHGVPWG